MISEEELLASIEKLSQEGKYDKVILLITDEILDTYRNNDLYLGKGKAYNNLWNLTYKVHDPEAAMNFFFKYLEFNPSNALAYIGLANLYVFLEDNKKAFNYYTEALALNTENADSYYGMGNAQKNLKKYDEAIEYYNKSLDVNSEFSFSYNGLADVYSILDKKEQAIELYRKAIKTDQSYEDPYIGLGNIFKDQRNYDEAIENYSKAIAINPNSSSAYYGLGVVYRLKKDYKKAIKFFNKAIRINPKFEYPYNGLGNVYIDLKDYNKAIELYKKAINIEPKLKNSYYGRAIAYQENELFIEAFTDFEKYIELTKNHPDYFTSVAKSKLDKLRKLIDSPDYSTISEIVDKIKKTLLFEERCVTHYTSFFVAKNLILENSKFRISEGTYLNDTSEGREIFDFLPPFYSHIPKANDTIAKPFAPKPFIGSFVAETKHDDLTLWRMYGKEDNVEARGCAITVDRKYLIENLKSFLIPNDKTGDDKKTDEEFRFYHVAYRTHDSKNSFIIPGATDKQETLNKDMQNLYAKTDDYLKKNELSDKKDLLELLNGIAYLFKSAEYQYEQELRLIVKGTGIEKTIFAEPKLTVYIDLVEVNPLIRKITLGPKVEKADEWASIFYYTLDGQGFNPEIHISRLPFK